MRGGWFRRGRDLRTLVDRHLEAGDPTGWFEPLYAASGRSGSRVPWAGDGPHPLLVDWLDEPVARVPGSRAVVVGSGLGHDAAELARRGFEVTAFDVAPSAIARARSRFADVDVTWRVDDLLALPDDLLGAFDLVVEVDTVGYLPGVVRDAAMDAVGRLAAPRGIVLAVTLLAADADTASSWAGPPWAQAPSELAVYRGSGLVRLAVEHGQPDARGGVTARLTFQRPRDAADDSGASPGLPIVG